MNTDMKLDRRLSDSDESCPRPFSGHYDQQVAAAFKRRLPSLPSRAIPLFALMDIVGNASAELHSRIFKPLGHNFTEYAILSTLLLYGDGMTPGDFTRLLGKASAGTAQALKRLEKNNYILREINSTDRRSSLVKLTPSGLERATTLCRMEAEMSNEVFSGISDDDLSEIQGALNKIILTLQPNFR